MAYTNLMVLADAIRRAGTTDMEPLKAALAATEYASPMGPTLRFTPSRRIRYQGFTTLITGQWRKGRLEVVFSPDLATAPLVYPAPAWRER